MIGFSLALRHLQEATQSKAWMGASPQTGRVDQELWGPAIRDGSETRGPMDQDGWADEHHLQGGPLSDESGQFSEASSMVSLHCYQVWYWSLHSVSEAFIAVTTSELEGTTTPVSTNSPACWVSTLPQVLPILDIPAASTLVGCMLLLALSLKHRKWDHSPSSTFEGQTSKWAHTCTEEGSISSGCSTLPTQPATSHRHRQLEPELSILPSSPLKAAANPNDSLALEVSGSTIDHDRDSAVDVSRDDTNQSGDEPDSSRNL